MDDEAKEAIEKMIGKAGEPVPVVDVADIKKMWAYGKELRAGHPQGSVGISINIWQKVLPPGTDIRAVSYRCGMLSMLEMMLEPVWAGGQLTEAAFKTIATMEMEWAAVGVVYKGGQLFNLEAFFAQARHEASLSA
jgi:hypothetical protein